MNNTKTNTNTKITSPILDKSVTYTSSSSVHENYWFQDLPNTLFNLDYAVKIIPNMDMTYPEKINALVRLSIYIGVILALFYTNNLFLYIPIVTMALTYVLYLFRLDTLEKARADKGPNAKLRDLSPNELETLSRKMGTGNSNFENVLNISRCNKPNTDNPFMNPLVFDSRRRDKACDPINPSNQLEIESEYNKYCIKDISDIWNHNSGRRQFYTVASTTYPNDQGGFANWLYRRPPTCKEGNGAQCIANYYTPLNSSLLTPGYGSTP